MHGSVGSCDEIIECSCTHIYVFYCVHVLCSLFHCGVGNCDETIVIDMYVAVHTCGCTHIRSIV